MTDGIVMKVRVRILRNGATIRVRPYRHRKVSDIIILYKKLSSTLPTSFRFQIEARDKSVIWIGGGTLEAQETT
jgi:hypothetical protein